MSASVNDNFSKVAVAGSETTLAAPGKALGATSININSAAGWPTDTGIVFAIRQVDNNGNLIPGTYTEWIGTLSGTTISGLTGSPLYGTDQVYPAAATTQVYIPLSSARENRIMAAILNQHNQDGSHGSITATGMANSGNESVAGTFSVAGAISGAGYSKGTIKNPYKFSVYRNSALNIGNSTSVEPIVFDTKIFDTGSNYSVSTGLFTAPIAGFYKFDVEIGGDTLNGDQIYANLFKNGALIESGPSPINGSGSTTDLILSASFPLIQLAQNDTIGVQFGHLAAYSMGVIVGLPSSGGAAFSGFLESAT